PVRAPDHIVAIAQRNGAGPAHPIKGNGADEAIGVGHEAARRQVAVPPRHRPAVAVPVWTGDQIVAVAQAGGASASHGIIRVAADEAIVHGNGAVDSYAAIAPGHGPALVVPV